MFNRQVNPNWQIQLVLVGKAQDECPGSIQLAPKGHEGLGRLIGMQQAHGVSHHAGQEEHLHNGGGTQQVKPPKATHVGDLGTMVLGTITASFTENAEGVLTRTPNISNIVQYNFLYRCFELRLVIL